MTKTVIGVISDDGEDKGEDKGEANAFDRRYCLHRDEKKGYYLCRSSGEVS